MRRAYLSLYYGSELPGRNVSSEGEHDWNPNAFDTANKAIYPGMTFWIAIDPPTTYISEWQTNLMKVSSRVV